jgi:hypothetical protein
MENSSPQRNLVLTDESVLSPVAVLMDGQLLIDVLARIDKNERPQFVMLTKPDWSYQGWTDDPAIVTVLALKHRFIALEAGAPTIRWGSRKEAIEELVKWVRQHVLHL